MLATFASFFLCACSGSDDSIEESIVLSQTKIECDINGIAAQVGVTANTAWNASVFDMEGNWVTVTPKSGTNNGSITIAVSANDGEARTATVKVFSNKADASVVISQAAAPKPEEPEEPQVTITPI